MHIRFTTESGAQYDIFEVEGVQYITRDCEIPVLHFLSGDEMPEIVSTRVWFDGPPVVGEPFFYTTASHGGCRSTPVKTVEETPDAASS